MSLQKQHQVGRKGRKGQSHQSQERERYQGENG